MTGTHLIPLGTTGWSLWRDALLRSTGFPADGLERYAAPSCAAATDAADGRLAGVADADDENLSATFAGALADASRVASSLAADPRFREAVTWQNAGALVALDGLVRGGPEARRNVKRRIREELVARYWQRYCGKNETISFFGPVCWTRIDPSQRSAVSLRVGPDLVRERRTFLEYWALAAYAETVAADPECRVWLPPALLPHLTLDGTQVRRPALRPISVSPVEAAVLSACDGRRPAREVVAALVDAGVVRRADDGLLILDRLVDRGLLGWGSDLPLSPDAEAVLVRQLSAISDEKVRERALAGLERLRSARDRVAAAAGSPETLRVALADLDREFVELTGAQPHRRPGQMYAGRALCYEETVRDLDIVFGAPVLDAIAAPLQVLLQAARWLTAALAHAYLDGLRGLHDELRADGEPVCLADLWYLAQGMLFGAGRRPVDAVVEDFTARWSSLFGLDKAPGGSRLELRSGDLLQAAAAAFPAERPGWSLGALHSPDLQICATDVEALNRGEFTVVLSELHTAWPTFDCALFTGAHPDVARLREALRVDLGSERVRPLYPTDWPRIGGRTTHSLTHPSDRQLAFTAAPGADPDRLLPVTAVMVSEVDGSLVATAPDGATWPLLEMFSWLVATHALDAFKVVARGAHSPRITVDRLVVARETWHSTIGETGLAEVTGDLPRYQAARAWGARLGLPERVFVKLATETKPCYVDLTSPTYASTLCGMLRSAAIEHGPNVAVTVSEMLPTPDEAWLPDADGNRYFSELRLQIHDPAGGES